MLLFEGILSDSLMVFAMNQAGKSTFSLTLLVPIKAKNETKQKQDKQKNLQRTKPYFWSAVTPVSLVLLKQIGIPFCQSH